MADADKLAQRAIDQAKQLAELVDLDALADRIGSVDAPDAPDLELGDAAHEIAEAASGAAEWIGQISHSVRANGGRLAGGTARWLLPLGAGAAALAAARNGPAIARSLRQVGHVGDLQLGERARRLPHLRDDDGGGSRTRTRSRRSDPRALRNHLRERAEHRERRRRQFSG